MTPFAVILAGSWSPEGWSDLQGFFTTRFVLAENEAQAAEIAKRRLLTELPTELPGCPQPKIDIEDIWEAEMHQLTEKQSGFTFYSELD